MANIDFVLFLGLHSTNNIASSVAMERTENQNEREHVIDITSTRGPSSSSSTQDRLQNGSDTRRTEEQPSTSVRPSGFQPAFTIANGSISRNSSSVRRGNGNGNGHGRRRSPLNSGLWISVELVITVSQIIASSVVLSLFRDEKPHAPLREWILGYASGCVATLPLLYWRYHHRNQTSDQDPSQPRQSSPESNVTARTNSYSLSSGTRTMEDEDHHTTTASGSVQGGTILNARVKVLMEYLKMALDCFFAVWFVVGNVWIFGGHSSSTEAPNLYRLCIVFLAFSCIGYAMPFILCATICCCLPCIISVLGFREELNQNRGATPESINSLPTYKFKIKKNRVGSDRETNSGSNEGIVAAGTEKERVISGEDAVCCICLSKYANNDELRELPCAHFFHKECVDKWLKINALCPLCKGEVGDKILSTISGENNNSQMNAVL